MEIVLHLGRGTKETSSYQVVSSTSRLRETEIEPLVVAKSNGVAVDYLSSPMVGTLNHCYLVNLNLH
ncbi:hypothetical protein PIB30_053701 [Stylosanthes scabra]|uniref:Uncharacterized protein n=1 Tax=Stylosanthes scabra TaxID=79078 RepID=A0ABU6YHE9_9FABA|nr:hypothetical protein [Stylosanthes scabra]